MNTDMRPTLELASSFFWYFKNGIILVARSAAGPMAGGAGTDFSTFHCGDVSVVNGGQTVSTIGKFGESNFDALENFYVPMRIIVRGDDESFADDVMRTNNRQNRIENRDFVTLDKE